MKLLKVSILLIVTVAFILIISLIVIIWIAPFDSANSRLQVKNNSSYDISVEIFQVDTIIHEIVNHPAYYMSAKISPGEIRRQIMPSPWKGTWYFENNVNKKLNVFIFSTDTIEKYGDFEHIINHKLYVRYEFEEKELDDMNWIIEYP